MESYDSSSTALVLWLLKWSGAEEKEDDEIITIRDSLHGDINIHPLVRDIIDTVEFDRLRDIRQLGSVFYVYPGKAGRWVLIIAMG